MAKADLTAQRLRELLNYDPETGVFTWRVRRRSFAARATVGAIAGSQHGNGYIEIGIDGYSYYAHRLAWLHMYGEWPENSIDHIDRCRANNAWKNLRQATYKQNQENRSVRADSGSGLKGVKLLPSGRWRAQIKHNFVPIHIGVYDTPEQAAAARAEAERMLFTHGALLIENPDALSRPDAIASASPQS